MKKEIMIAIIFGALAGGLIAYYIVNQEPSQQDLIKEWYAAETAVHVSPHHIRKHIADDDFVLVDLRSQEEYEREHVIGALNVPAYASPEKSAYGDVERIVNGFNKIITDNPGKDIIVYCYSMPCMTGRKIGKMLTEHGIYVMHLGIGWNEWRHHWTLWNHEHEWDQVKVEDYIISGPQPGKFKGETTTVCPIEGDFGC